MFKYKGENDYGEKILIDTENMKFEINGMDITGAKNLIITFSNGEWNYNMCSSSKVNKAKELEKTISKEDVISQIEITKVYITNSPKWYIEFSYKGVQHDSYYSFHINSVEQATEKVMKQRIANYLLAENKA